MVSVKATAMLIILTFCVLATDTSAAYYGCCRSYLKKKLPFSVIKGYSAQTVSDVCHIPAIIFHTKKGQACANPSLKWVMEYINLLRKKAQRVHLTPKDQEYVSLLSPKGPNEDLKTTDTELFCNLKRVDEDPAAAD